MDEKKVMNTINELIDRTNKAIENNNMEEVYSYLEMIYNTTKIMPLSSSTLEEILKKAKEVQRKIEEIQNKGIIQTKENNNTNEQKQVSEEPSIFRNIKMGPIQTKEKEEFDIAVYELTHPRL